MMIVEDGTGVANADTYCSIADADAYHAAHGNTPWDDTPVEAKESALRYGARYLDGTYGPRFTGYVMTDDQGLLWPRLWVAQKTDGPQLPREPLPALVKEATAELALRGIMGAGLGSDLSTDWKSVRVGELTIDMADTGGRSQTFAWIDRMLSPLLKPPG